MWYTDSAYPLPGPRFSQILASSKSPSSAKPVSDLLLNFTHFFTPSFAHLLALFSRTTTAFPSSSTSLIVIDSLSTLISSAFPRSADSSSTPKKPGVVNPSARKFPLMQYLLTSISKLATTRNIAIVLLSPCVTKMQPGLGATLVPAINTTAWDQGLGCRVALFRDWDWETEMDEEGQGFLEVRFAEILKAEGTTAPSGRGRIAAFGISGDGIHPVTLPAYSPAKTPLPLPRNPITSTPSLPRKRKLSATDLEIPDSEGEDDEDYGWGEEDEEAMPGMPPQWQGSEDILIAPVVELEEEEEEDGQEDEEVTLPRLPEREIEDSEDELGISQ
ncbi:rad55 protein [Phlyctema vagabunda]|uniref:Rad55 protein n=1 Tax=Phlyctema vagabunda TaxID=108571 RepID=A0ABR4PYN9_9HELO